MKPIRYSKWKELPIWHEGRQDELAARMFDELVRNMNWSLTAQEALEWMQRHGMEFGDIDLHVMGADELIQQLRNKRQQAFQDVNFNSALKEIAEKIETLVDIEINNAREALGSIHPQFHIREEAMRSLPWMYSAPPEKQSPRSPPITYRVGPALQALADYADGHAYLSGEARHLFEQLLQRREDIAELEEFIRRYGRQFQGPESLDFEQALVAMHRFKALTEMSEMFKIGNFRDISAEEMREELGERAAQSVMMLAGITQMLEKSGMISSADGRIRLTPRGSRKISQQALMEIYNSLRKGFTGAHPTNEKGTSGHVREESIRYEFGAPFNVHIVNSLKNAIIRGGGAGHSGAESERGKANQKVTMEMEDFEIHQEEISTRTTTVLMLDMSWSMSREGRFPAAKKVALAMDHMIRTRYPFDRYFTLGFSTRAREIDAGQLAEATWDPSDPFTNIQEGLLLARKLFKRAPGGNRQVIMITDGQPTATHIDGFTNAQWPGFMGAIPPDILEATLQEVSYCTREKIVINVFMLDDNPILKDFVERMVRINSGRAFYSHPERLGKYLLVDFLRRRTKLIA
ncbi:MAG: VWA domain-containing protein [Deltaproteobacteria bacterium]|nr:VWA domain-containing protein [Deltaproteobacteria bacterium]